ncbi:MAG: hypothetical protein ACFE96_15460 [Candidatus Hermodarchaeota archaeon]
MNKHYLSRIKRKTLCILIVFVLFGVSAITYRYFHNLTPILSEAQTFHTSPIVEQTKEIIKNHDFSDPIDPWDDQASGADPSDVLAGYTPGEGYFRTLGEQRTFSEISGKPLYSEWEKVHNPEFPAYPDDSNITTEGCWVTHEFAELADQTPSVHWERNISMPVDMSDYIITSASITAVINATVTASPGGWSGGGVEAPGDVTDLGGTQNYTWDYVRFYVLLSDLTKNKIYEIAYNQTSDLGKDSAGSTDSMSDTLMTPVLEEDLIFYLTSVLSSDFHNFTITLGIRIWCEDNWLSDRDIWDDLLIKSCSLTFTYEKKMDQFTKLSWNYVGDKISGQNVSIIDGNLRFKYKIDQLWPIALSPNSRLNILINNNSLLETLKLSNAPLGVFEEAKTNGFDVTKLILKDINISLSIQLFIGDEFPLSQNYTISITNVYLSVIYNVYVPETEEEPWFFTGLFIIAAMAAAVISGLLIAYIKVWRFPVPIRKVRKHRKALPSEKDPDVKIISREIAFKSSFHKEVSKTSKSLKGPPIDGKIEKEKLFKK